MNMYKSIKAPGTLKTLVTLTPLHKSMIDRFMAEKGMLSQADVVRQAITFFYSKHFPNYVDRETVAGQLKKKTLQEQEAYDKLTDEDYIKQNFPDAIFTVNSSSIPYVVIQGYGNALTAYPVEGFKDLATNDPLIKQFHDEGMAQHSMAEMLSPYATSLLEKHYKISLLPYTEK